MPKISDTPFDQRSRGLRSGVTHEKFKKHETIQDLFPKEFHRNSLGGAGGSRGEKSSREKFELAAPEELMQFIF